jgi:ABC-type multidrug transport system fused ATPase/permease subunit
LGDKLANLIFAIFTCIGGIGLGFFRGSTFAACCLAYAPVFLIILGVFGSMVKKSTESRLESVKQLGGRAAEVFYSIKVVQSFVGE